MTASDVHKKIQEISLKYISGKPPITIENLVTELNISEHDLANHLNHLNTLGLVHREEDIVFITDSGMKAQLP